MTDSQGNFELPLDSIEGSLEVLVLGDEGGQANEPVSGTTIDLSFTDSFSTLMTGVVLGRSISGVIVSPWSTLVTTRALWDHAKNQKPVAQALVESAQLFANHFGGVGFLSSVPLDPTAGPTNGLSSGAIHGFATTALEIMGENLSHQLQLTPDVLITVDSLTQLLADDLSDGILDGRDANGPIAIVGTSTLPAEATRADLGAALGTFITSAQNKSGVTLSDLGSTINAIANDNSALYASAPSLATGTATAPPSSFRALRPTAPCRRRLSFSARHQLARCRRRRGAARWPANQQTANALRSTKSTGR